MVLAQQVQQVPPQTAGEGAENQQAPTRPPLPPPAVSPLESPNPEYFPQVMRQAQMPPSSQSDFMTL